MPFRVFEKFRRCRFCGSSWVVKDNPLNFRERRVLRLLMLRPFYCEKCGGRFYGFRHAKSLDRRRRPR
jgi:hypothetical protein